MKREIRFKIYLQHEDTGVITSKAFDYASIFSGAALECIRTQFPRHFVIGKSEFTGYAQSKKHPVFDDKEKLWEGDIFTTLDSNTKYKVVFENYEWIGISNEGDDWGKFRLRISAIKKPINIIGNILENPELFEAVA
jgi:hypothetical protein